MKRKNSIITSAIASALVLGAGAIIPFATSGNVAYAESNSNEIYYVNNNQIAMTKDQYDLLNTIGFDESEIDDMLEEKFNKLMSMEVLNTQHETSIVYDGDEIHNTEADDNLVDILENVQQSTVSTMSTPRKFSTSDGTKIMDTYVSFVRVTSRYKLYVKQNVTWKSAPKDRYSDILSIRYTNNIRVAEYNSYPDVEMHLKYTMYEMDMRDTKNIKNKNYNVDKAYTGKDQSAYEHKIGDYFAFQFELPVSTPPPSPGFPVTFMIWQSDFCVTMETTFDTNISNLTGTELQAYYVHQNDSGHIDWGKLSFTTSPPYISYSTDIWINDPGFEAALFRSISVSFDDVWLSRC